MTIETGSKTARAWRHFPWRIACGASVLLASAAGAGAAGDDPGMPHLEVHGSSKQLVVDGHPFLALGGELHNSSSSSVEFMKAIWPALVRSHLNTVVTPVSWELTEPVEGQFDFSIVDGLIHDASANHLHLVLLWFGSWKNGLSSYPPLWVKADPTRFPLAQNAKGEPQDILSTFGDATAAADGRAFAALLHHLRGFDTGHTVLAVQVENEVGMRGDSRDRCPAANAAFAGAVPGALMDVLTHGGDAAVPEFRHRWEAAGSKSTGTWTQIFGDGLATDELFMAWQYARFVGRVAAAGKAEYPIPMYANCWLDQPGTPNPGDYPSGGPLAHLMNVWKIGAPALDFVSPDLYVPEFAYRCRIFTRLGNPLFIPETNTGDRAGANALLAFGKFDAMGFSPFGIDGGRAGFGVPPAGMTMPDDDERTSSLSQTYAALQKIEPLVLASQGTGKMTAVLLGPGAEDESLAKQEVHLNGYTLTVTPRRNRYRPAATQAATTQPAPLSTAGGLFIATGPDEFVILTTGLDVKFQRDHAVGTTTVASMDDGEYVDGTWVRGRRYNGDQTDHNREPTRSMLPYRVLRIKLYQRP